MKYTFRVINSNSEGIGGVTPKIIEDRHSILFHHNPNFFDLFPILVTPNVEGFVKEIPGLFCSYTLPHKPEGKDTTRIRALLETWSKPIPICSESDSPSSSSSPLSFLGSKQNPHVSTEVLNY